MRRGTTRPGIPHGTAWYRIRRGIACRQAMALLRPRAMLPSRIIGSPSFLAYRWARHGVRGASGAWHSTCLAQHAGTPPLARASDKANAERCMATHCFVTALRGQLQWRVRRNGVDRHDDQGVAGFSGWRCASALDSSSLSAVRTCVARPLRFLAGCFRKASRSARPSHACA